MKRLLYFILTVAILLCIIPLTALLGTPKSKQDKNGDYKPLDAPDGEASEVVYRVQNHKTGEIMELSPTKYIRGVVAAEMPISFHSEALKAQAIAAHTYALLQISQQMDSPELGGAFLTTDHTINQAYLSDEELMELWGSNYDYNMQKLAGAVNEVVDLAMVYDGKPIIAAFHSLSAGITESAQTVWGQEVPYLRPVDSEGDALSPNYEVATRLTTSEVSHALKEKYPEIVLPEDKAGWFEITDRSESGSVLSLNIGSVSCSGKELRELLGLRSASFEIEYLNNEFIIKTTGYGHGVGMSQYGADFMARQGSRYEEILKHYYNGVTLEHIYEKDIE